MGVLFTLFYHDYRRPLPKVTPAAAAAAAAVSVNVAQSYAALAAPAPWFHCCFKIKGKHHPLAFINANKYLSTKIAHPIQPQVEGWCLPPRWSPDVQAHSLVFIQHTGRPLIKKVCAKRHSCHQPNGSTLRCRWGCCCRARLKTLLLEITW